MFGAITNQQKLDLNYSNVPSLFIIVNARLTRLIPYYTSTYLYSLVNESILY